jgi:hypothetical protein
MGVFDYSAWFADAGGFILVLDQVLGADIWTGLILLEKNRAVMVDVVENDLGNRIALASRDGAFGHEFSFANSCAGVIVADIPCKKTR